MLSLSTISTMLDKHYSTFTWKSTPTLTSKHALNLSFTTSPLKPKSKMSNMRSLPARDSLVQIHSQCKRRSENCPLDNLRHLVATKRQRRDAVTPRRVVRFDLEENQVFERSLTEEDLHAAWMSPIDQLLVKKRLYEVIFLFRNGFLNTDQDSIRGLEFHAYSGLSLKKLTQAKQYRQTILSHQHQSYLGQLSETLSAQSSKVAIELALYDTEEARAAIHG